MTKTPPAMATYSNHIIKLTKKDYEDIFTSACWTYYVWDQGNKRALKTKNWAQENLDAQWCVRTSHQIQDLELRKRWLAARLDGSPLPRVTSAVKRHFEQEFQKSYPQGVSDVQ